MTRDLLDYLAGISSPIGVSNFFATNDPDNLDDRLTRKGRFKELIYIGPVDAPGIRRWLKHVHSYTVPDDMTMKPMLCMDIFDRMDTLDDPELFVAENSL